MDKIMVVDNIEDIVENGEVIGKLVTDKAGNKLKVKVGQGGHLKKKWDELIIGRAYKFIMGEFKGFPFVQDFEEVKSIIEKEAAEKVTSQMVDTKDRSITLSYVVWLADAGVIQPTEILEYAEVFYRYVTGNLGIGDEQVLQLTLKMLRGGQDEAEASKEVKSSEASVKTEREDKIYSPPTLTEIPQPAIVEFEALARKKLVRDSTIISWLRVAFDPSLAKNVDWKQVFNELDEAKQKELLGKLKKHATTPASVK